MTTTTTERTAREHLADLKDRILNGDESITAAALAKAEDAVQLEDLRSEALERARAAEAQATLEAEQARVRAEELPRITAAIDEVRATYDAAIDAARALAESIEAMAPVVAEVRRSASKAGIAEEARALWTGYTLLPTPGPVLATLAADAAGTARTMPTREDGIVAFDRKWFDSDDRAAAGEAALEERNSRRRANRAAAAARSAEQRAEREAAGLVDGEVELKGGWPGREAITQGPDWERRFRRAVHATRNRRP